MSQATVTLPIDSYNRLVQQANALNNQAMSIATKLEGLKANIHTIRSPQQIESFISAAVTILRSPITEPEALIPPAGKPTSAKSQA